jgi:Holliday junction resolvase RusA-like endonuclease
MSLDISFTVEGRPVPQGSMTASYNRTTKVAHVHHVQGAALAQWRAAVRDAARSAMRTEKPYINAVEVGLLFQMQRPNSHIQIRLGSEYVKPRYRNAQVTTTPDIDKLIRAVLDALTGIVYLDDSQVVSLHAMEVYALEPGLAVRVRGHDAKRKEDAIPLGKDSEVHSLEGQGGLLSLWERRGG